MTSNFYDKVAKKFGGYHTPHKHTTEYPNGEPEKVFKDKLLELSGKNKTALDVGCADGRFTLAIASHFQKIIAIDLSKEMLKSAKKLQKKMGIANVSFEEQDAHHTTYRNSFFSIVYSRRGPSDFTESYRLLKPGGYFVEIDIGERDCQAIKEVFGMGQGFGEWNNKRLEKDRLGLTKAGFEIIFIEEFFYDEYYASKKDLDTFLQGVPIFEDFDSEKDKKSLEKYTQQHTTEKGIDFPRHRVVTIAKKPNRYMQ